MTSTRRIAVVVTCLATCVPTAALAAPSSTRDTVSLGTKAIAPVGHGSSRVPHGYTLVQTDVLSRHGARALSSAKYTDLALLMVADARAHGSLTRLGARFEVETRRMQAANEALGWGNLSARGTDQMTSYGARVARRTSQLGGSGQFLVQSSGEARATASAEAFEAGFASVRPQLALGGVAANKALLYFHKSDKAYQTYVDGDEALHDAEARVLGDPSVVGAQRTVLAGLFGHDFVRRLESGQVDLATADGASVSSLAEASDIVYGLYSIAPSLSEEGPFDMAQFVPVQARRPLGLASDAVDFLEKGPSLAGRDDTYAMARPLLADFLSTAGNPDVSGVFRFSHAEELIPFLAVLQVEGSDRQLPLGARFSWARTGWYGSEQAPLGGNVEWDVYRDRSGRRLVRMLVNERPTAFKASCHQVGERFYTLDELRRCYAGELAVS